MIGESNVGEVRHCGVILAFDLDLEMQRYGRERNIIFQWFWNKGIFLRPLGKTIYLVPPFTTTAQELEFLYQTILEFLESR